MGLESKKDNTKENTIDTNKSGRPVRFSLGDGEDFNIDLPQDIPGLEKNTNDMNDEEIDSLISDINRANQEIEDLLKKVGIDDIKDIGKDY